MKNIVNNFISGPKETRRAIIEEALGLDMFNLYFEEAKAKRTLLENEINKIIQLQADLQSNVDNFKRNISNYQEVDFIGAKSLKEKEKAIILEQFTKQIESIKNMQLTHEDELKLAKESMLNGNEQHTHQSTKQFVVSLTKILGDLQEVAKYSKSVTDSNECPSCGQNIANIANVLQRNIKSVEAVKARIQQHNSDIKRFLDAQFDINKVLSTDTLRSLAPVEHGQYILKAIQYFVPPLQALDKALDESHKKQQRLDKIKMALLELDKQLLLLENEKQKQIAVVDIEISKLESALKEKEQYSKLAEKQHEDMVKQLDDYAHRLPTLNQDFQIAKFWELAFDKKSKLSGMGSLRAFILESAVADLNAIFASYMNQLTDNPLTVTFTSELEIKEDYAKR